MDFEQVRRPDERSAAPPTPRLLSDQRPSVALFVALAFGLSWVGGFAANFLLGGWAVSDSGPWRTYLVNLPSTWGPAAAAVILTLRANGAAGAVRMLAALLPSKTTTLWIVVLPITGVVLTTSAYVMSGAALEFGVTDLTLAALAAHLVLQLLAVGIGEELGWRGWLLPRLVRRHTLLRATLLTGLIWWLWHLPKLFGPLQVTVPLSAIVLSTSFLLSLIWIATRGNLLVLAVAHVSVNAPVYWFEWSGTLTPDEVLRGWAVLAAVYIALAVASLAVYRRLWAHPTPLELVAD